MTDHEMRQRLAEAMGWTDLRAGAVRTLSGVLPEQNILVRTGVPDPLERDQDAALLRAWCVAQGWYLDLRAMPDCLDRLGPRTGCTVTVRYEQPVKAGMYWAYASEEPDYCRRERLSLCRAVLQAIEIGCASRGPLHGLAGPQV